MSTNATNFPVREPKLFCLSWSIYLDHRPIEGTRMCPCLNWDLNSAPHLIMEKYLWPTVQKDVINYVKTCNGCQNARSIPTNRSTVRLPGGLLFDVLGPFHVTSSGNCFMLVALRILTVWLIVMRTAESKVHGF